MDQILYEAVMAKVLATAEIKWFTARELCQVGRTVKKDGELIRLTPPPAALFKNMVETVKVADWLREKVGLLRVLSGYRSPEYNAAVDGSDGSLHMEFNALDLVPPRGVTPVQLATLATKHFYARKMGIGIYPTFVHIDTRGLIGHVAPARWPQADWQKIDRKRVA